MLFVGTVTTEAATPEATTGTTGRGRLTYCEVSVILQVRGVTLTLMNVLYYIWGPSNLL